MAAIQDPAQYDAWYHTLRGAWIGDIEFALLMSLLRPAPGATLLDVGCGTGYFSRRFAAAGLRVTGIDPDASMIAFARSRPGDSHYIQGSATEFPFGDGVFDYCAAVTSLCFVSDVTGAVQKMWRVTRRTMVLGLLNRHSLLYRQKHGRGSYAGARWDTESDVRKWIASLRGKPVPITAYAVFIPAGGRFSQICEQLLPRILPVGSFVAVSVKK